MAFSYGNIWHSPDKYELSTTTWSSSSTRMLSKFILRGSCAVQNLPTCLWKNITLHQQPGTCDGKHWRFLEGTIFFFHMRRVFWWCGPPSFYNICTSKLDGDGGVVRWEDGGGRGCAAVALWRLAGCVEGQEERPARVVAQVKQEHCYCRKL